MDLGLQNLKDNLFPPLQVRKSQGRTLLRRLICITGLCLGAVWWGNKKSGVVTHESHAHPCEVNGSSVSNHLVGVGEKPVPQDEGSVVPFIFDKCMWHKTTPSPGRGIIYVHGVSAKPALPHSVQGASQALAGRTPITTFHVFPGSCRAITSATFCITFLQNPFIPHRLSVSIIFLWFTCPKGKEE